MNSVNVYYVKYPDQPVILCHFDLNDIAKRWTGTLVETIVGQSYPGSTRRIINSDNIIDHGNFFEYLITESMLKTIAPGFDYYYCDNSSSWHYIV